MKNICTFVARNKMKKNLKNIFARTWGLMMSTTATWEDIAEENSKENDSFLRFVLPWIAFSTFIILIFDALYAEVKFVETGFVHAFINVIALLGAYYFTLAITSSILKKNMSGIYSVIKVEKIVAYSFSVIYVLKVVAAVIPSLFFLQILDVYTVYIVWEGCRVIFNIDEDERGKIMLFISLSIIFTPMFIKRVILLMLPAF